jgi:hypothetical protein
MVRVLRGKIRSEAFPIRYRRSVSKPGCFFGIRSLSRFLHGNVFDTQTSNGQIQ